MSSIYRYWVCPGGPRTRGSWPRWRSSPGSCRRTPPWTCSRTASPWSRPARTWACTRTGSPRHLFRCSDNGWCVFLVSIQHFIMDNIHPRGWPWVLAAARSSVGLSSLCCGNPGLLSSSFRSELAPFPGQILWKLHLPSNWERAKCKFSTHIKSIIFVFIIFNTRLRSPYRSISA